MDASQYKDYVLVLLFIKYVSDKYAGMPYAPITIPKGSSFMEMVALKEAAKGFARQGKDWVVDLQGAWRLAATGSLNTALSNAFLRGSGFLLPSDLAAARRR